ncbi:unnamed protein product [Rangifer tarandus platyrhynchus]|uniref:Uncharacterized protein n=2 Tax=Rangifer tarandus platyrhynchus TaxID=3082113 RepID=A0ACB0ETR6_RANTA|nr:unnamed protein product [Rangifer tarandus platyrhynchus]CAI9703963.1 unnamed protein product [Rangifer tarandus platyrhynchus]
METTAQEQPWFRQTFRSETVGLLSRHCPGQSPVLSREASLHSSYSVGHMRESGNLPEHPAPQTGGSSEAQLHRRCPRHTPLYLLPCCPLASLSLVSGSLTTSSSLQASRQFQSRLPRRMTLSCVSGSCGDQRERQEHKDPSPQVPVLGAGRALGSPGAPSDHAAWKLQDWSLEFGVCSQNILERLPPIPSSTERPLKAGLPSRTPPLPQAVPGTCAGGHRGLTGALPHLRGADVSCFRDSRTPPAAWFPAQATPSLPHATTTPATHWDPQLRAPGTGHGRRGCGAVGARRPPVPPRGTWPHAFLPAGLSLPECGTHAGGTERPAGGASLDALLRKLGARSLSP